VARKDRDGVLSGAFTVVTPMTQREHNGKHLAIMNVIVAFSGIRLARPESDGMKLTVMLLTNDARRGEARRVGVEVNGQIRVEMSKDWCPGEQVLETLEVRLGF
jgi:hypothetical protein